MLVNCQQVRSDINISENRSVKPLLSHFLERIYSESIFDRFKDMNYMHYTFCINFNCQLYNVNRSLLRTVLNDPVVQWFISTGSCKEVDGVADTCTCR